MSIAICPDCNGEGFGIVRDRWDNHEVPCVRCNKTGRVITFKYFFDIPFNTDMQKIYPIDNQIHEWIRLIPTMINKSEPIPTTELNKPEPFPTDAG
jgi:hypothetical protein